MAGGALAVAADGDIFQPNDPHLVELEIPLSRLPAAWDGLRIAQLSDFHYDPYFSAVPIRKAVAVVNRLQPDLVVLTGDFVSEAAFGGDPAQEKRPAPSTPASGCCASCAGASSESLAILGNHDCGTDPRRVTRTLEAHGIPVLSNRSISLERGDARLWLAGTEDALEGDPDLSRSPARHTAE